MRDSLAVVAVFLMCICWGLFIQTAMAQSYSLPVLYNQKKNDFIIIAHRGASAYYPENTIPAFEAAIRMGAEMIELDVQLSSDGVPVVFHDPVLQHHSDGYGPLKKYTFAELKQLDAGSWFEKKFSGTTIPALEEVLALASGKITLNIEIKTQAVSDQLAGGVEEKCLELVEKYNMEERVLFSSFDYRAVEHLKKLNSRIPVALLYNRFQSGKKRPSELIRHYRADAFNYSYKQFNLKWVKNLEEHHIPHFVYTVNDTGHMRQLIDAGVSGIFTDKPDLLRSIVDQYLSGDDR